MNDLRASGVLHPDKRENQNLSVPLKLPELSDVGLASLYFSGFRVLECDYCPLVCSSFLGFSTFCLPPLLSSSSPPPSLSLWGLSVGMRERGEWGRQALSWLNWEPLAPCELGPVLPPLSINLQ